MIHGFVTALVVAAGAPPIIAQTAPSPPPVTTPARTPPGVHLAPPTPARSGDVSAFVACDGSKGHAGVLAKLGQIVAITATAGLASDALNDNGSTSNRQNGTLGIAACEAALRVEKDELRRVELGIARTVHYVEAKDLDGALVSVRQVPDLAGSLARDIGYRASVGSAVSLLEANILARLGRAQEAEDAALRSTAMAPYELFAHKRALPYMGFTGTMSDAKRAYFEQLTRMCTERLDQFSYALTWAGDYRGAAQRIFDLQRIEVRFYPKSRPEWEEAARAIDFSMVGDLVQSNQLAAAAAKHLEEFSATPGGASHANFIATVDEFLAFQRVARLLAEGDAAKARITFAARDRWAHILPPLIADMVGRLRVGAKPDELVGLLARDPAKIRQDALATHLASISADENSVAKLFEIAANQMRASSLAATAGSVYKVEPKPRMLLRQKADEALPYDIVDTEPYVYGLEAGEALLLHSALIARARGKEFFIMRPNHPTISANGVLFVNSGEDDLPTNEMFRAETVIADISPMIPPPAR